jgi:hypothetical protein
MATRYHSLERTNPKGQPFRGVCVLCGKTDLPMSAVQEECPPDEGFPHTKDLTEEEVLIRAIRGMGGFDPRGEGNVETSG